MLVRQIPVIRQLRVTLLRGIDHAVLLHQHDVAAEQFARQCQQRRVAGQREERIVVDERAARRERVADGRHPLRTAELLDLAGHHLIETAAEVGDVGGGEFAGQDGVAHEADAIGQLPGHRVGGGLLHDAVPRRAAAGHATSHRHPQEADRTTSPRR
jgi:hypothetical protein